MGILIKNGIIVDGTGSPRFNGDVLIENEIILKIGENIKAEDVEIIDAKGKIVSPGFIDMHNHADLVIFEDNDGLPFLKQGMTTLVVGCCGIGVAPANEKVKKYYYNFVYKAFCVKPPLFMNLGEFFETLEKKGVGVNLAFLIPQGNVRGSVLGTESRGATSEEMAQMAAIVEENMKAGAFGMSTGLVYPPGSVTPTEELIELSKVVSKYDGIYDSHMRNEGAGVIDIGMSELIRIAREANVRAHISHWSVISGYKYEELTEEAIDLMRNARKEGLEITADLTTYDDGYTNLSFVLLPTWVYEDFHNNLSNSETRERVKKEIFEKIYSMFLSDAPFYLKIIPKSLLKRIIFPKLAQGVTVIQALRHHEFEGKTLFNILNEKYPNKNIEEALLDYILEEDGGIMIRIQHKHEDESMIPLLKQDSVCPSSDAVLSFEGNTHPRSFNAFPRAIKRWVREKEVFSLEEMIKRMTSVPGSILKLSDRGLIKENKRADIVIFDYDKIEDRGTLQNGRQYPEGIEYVILNGKIAIKDGEYTGTLNGSILKNK